MKTTLQSRLKSALEESPLSQTALAKLVGISQPTLSELMNTDGAGSAKLPQIAHHLGVRPLWLATGEGPRYEADFFLDEAESELIQAWRSFPTESRRLILAQFRAISGESSDQDQSGEPRSA